MSKLADFFRSFRLYYRWNPARIALREAWRVTNRR